MFTRFTKEMTGSNPGNRFREASGVLTLTLILTLSGAAAHLLAIGTQSREATLSGRLLDPAGLPVPGAAIKLLDINRGSIQATTTNSRGRFHFQRLSAGEYRLSAATSGFEINNRQLTLGAGEAAFRSITLKLKAPTQEVTVSATGSARDTFRTPGEVNIISRQVLEQNQARSLDDVLRYQPGIEMTGTTRRLGQQPNIRGFDSERVLVLRDGARISQFTSAHKGSLFLDPADIERIEVVRGPGSALYGSGALGGVISITSRDPADLLDAGRTWGGSIGSSYSSAYNEWVANSKLYGAAPGGVQWSLGYTARQNNGTVDVGGPQGNLKFSDEDIDDVTAHLIVPAGRNDIFRFSFDSFRENGPTSTNLAGDTTDDRSLVDRTTTLHTYSLQHQHYGEKWWHRSVRTSFYVSDMSLGERRFSDRRLDDTDFLSWGFDVSNTVPIGEEQHLTYGVEFFRDDQNSRRNESNNLFFPNGDQSQTGVYLQDEISLLSGRLTLVPGFRLDFWGNNPDDPDQVSSSDSSFNPKLGGTYEIIDGLLVEGNYAEGFRAPRFQELFIGGAHFAFPLPEDRIFQAVFIPNPDLKPEKSRNEEVGLRYRRKTLSLRADYWRAQVDNFINFRVASQTPFPPPGGLLVQKWQAGNVADATLEGVEASMDWDFLPQWTWHAAYSNSRGNDDRTGETLQSVLPEKLVMGLDWKESFLGTTVGLSTRIYYGLSRGEDSFAGYTLHDFHLSWVPPPAPSLTISFGVDNFTDKKYLSPTFGMPGVGRDVRIGFRYRFSR
ncbi:MAG: TonB-dependent hemoglobin/transferrin/lactoferrin family receptor [Acidobacteriota bacterium]